MIQFRNSVSSLDRIMSMRFATFGYLAGFCTTVSFIPQVVRAWHTRHTDDLAWGWLVIFAMGLSLWLVYGLLLHNWPMIFANVVTLCLCGALMLMKLRFSSARTSEDSAETADLEVEAR